MRTVPKNGLVVVLFVCTIACVCIAIKNCNEAVCRGIVSKCLLLQSCMCVAHNSTCYKTCFECLGSYTDECCPCFVEVFPDFCVLPPEPMDGNEDRQSVVEEFKETIPGLFRALTVYPDHRNRWEAITFPINIDVDQFDPHNEHGFNIEQDYEGGSRKSDRMKRILTFNCTVVFMHDCVSRIKCRKNCLTMGAISYRWFHNGCCECAGERCVYYGLDKSQCMNCPPADLEEFDENDDEYEYDYDDM